MIHKTVNKLILALNGRRVTQQQISRASGLSQAAISALYNTRWDKETYQYRPAPRPSTIAALERGLKSLSSGRRPAHKPVKACAGKPTHHVSPRKGSSR